MNPITSIYISKIDKMYNAEFISNVFDINGIAMVNKILLEPRKNDDNYNKAFIEIKEWYDTESAFYFISRLRDPLREARIVYGEDNWWNVEINKFPHTISTKCENFRVITIFRDRYFDSYEDDDTITTNDAIISPQYVSIDYEKTRQLKAILYGYKNIDEMNDAEDFEEYLREAHQEINHWNSCFDKKYSNKLAFYTLEDLK